MINKINKLSQSEFIKVFANIFEKSSWIAYELYKEKPFDNFENLFLEILAIFDNATKDQQLKILNAHPDLADKIKINSLSSDSKKEQIYAGLDQCSKKELNEFKNLNYKYKKKFGFPFIYAVKGKYKIEILSNFRQRASYDIIVEFNEAKKQVKKIAGLRLNEINKK